MMIVALAALVLVQAGEEGLRNRSARALQQVSEIQNSRDYARFPDDDRILIQLSDMNYALCAANTPMTAKSCAERDHSIALLRQRGWCRSPGAFSASRWRRC